MTVSTRLQLPPGARLALTTLGDVAVYVSAPGSTPERVLEIGKPLALIIYLACFSPREAPRDALIDLLWSHMERDRAQNALRQTIWQIKARVGEHILTASRDRISLSDSIEVDRDAFLAAAAAGDVDRVVELYKGHFVTGFAAPGGTNFEHWADVERIELLRVFVRSAEELVQRRLASGRAREGLALARRARDLDRLNQRTWRLVLECLIAAGDTVGANVEADALAHHLEVEELEREPMTVATMRQLRAVANGPSARKPADSGNGLVAELIGREREFAAIMQAWTEVGRGQTRHFHIVAPPGLGKTRFLIDVQNRLRAAGARAVYLRADFGTRDIAYAFAGEAAARLSKLRGASGISSESAGTLVALNPSLSSLFNAPRDVAVDDEALRRRVLALRELVTTIAEEQPIALLIDDVHWADALSFRALDAAFGGIEKSHVLVVSAGRPTADDARRPTRASPIVLAPLSTDAVAALVSSLADLPPEPWAERLAGALEEATGGSPLLVLETLQLLIEQTLLVRSDDRWFADDADAVFRTLTQGSALRRRVASLAPTERWILLLLAVSGVPLDRRVLFDAAGESSDDFAAAVLALEQRGLVLRNDDALSAAHDEHATAAVEAASIDSVQRAAEAVGTVLLSNADSDIQKLRISGALLARSGEVGHRQLSTAFERFVRVKRRSGDRRPDRALAGELLAASATAPALMRSGGTLEESLVRSLPWLVRARLVSAPRVATAIAITGIALLAGVGAWTLRSRPTRPADAVLVARHLSADRATFELFPVQLDASHWAGISVLDVPLSGRPKWYIKSLTGNGGFSSRPDGRGWTGGVSVADSGVIDIFDFAFDGTVRRLTFAPLDDYQPSWAPDNRRFVFVTSRWSRHGHYDLAIYDTLTHDVHHLTSGDDTDESPKWSPDGSRIAFARLYGLSGGRGLCAIDADGSNLRCLPPYPNTELSVAGWSDSHRVFVRRMVHDTLQLARVDLETGVTDLVDDHGAPATISPDGKFAVCRCERRGHPPGTWIVYPVERPNEFAVLRVTEDGQREVQFEWAPTTSRLPFLASLSISLGIGPPLLGVSHQLSAAGFDSAGGRVEPGVVRWRSEDTSVATIDSTGRLVPRRTGRVAIVASAGGWREARTVLTIGEPSERVMLDERWTGELAPAWRAFGVPQPRLVSDATFGRAFLNNGDGSFFSGAYTTRAFATRDGLWVEAELSTPITASESQEISVYLFNMVDSSAWAAWDHVTGDGPAGGSAPGWSIRYPGGAGGKHFGDQIAIPQTEPRIVDVPPSFRTGRPFHLVMQIFPDGRCGVALDGKVTWIGQANFFEPAVHVMLAGNSVDTQILVGHVRVVTGIAPKIDWEGRARMAKE